MGVRRSHYEVLGVERTASGAEIKAAYRKLALEWHPDRNPGDAAAEERFKELAMAYAVLGEADKRAHYDRFGERLGAAGSPFGAGGDLNDLNLATDFFNAIFGDLFGVGRKKAAGQDLRYTLELDFEEAALGCEKTIAFSRQEDCDACRGTGAEGGAAGLYRCDKCGGQGSIKQRAGFFAAKRECAACEGAGELPKVRCSACKGLGLGQRERAYTVRVPAGSLSGSTQRVAGEGSPGRRGGPAGDLFVYVRVRPHPFFREEGTLLVCELPISPVEAALGAEVEVPLLDERVLMKIPPGTQPGAVFRLRGKGIPRPGVARGDAHVRVVVEIPVALEEEARALLIRLGGLLGDDSLPRRRAFRAPRPAVDKRPGAAAVAAVPPPRTRKATR